VSYEIVDESIHELVIWIRTIDALARLGRDAFHRVRNDVRKRRPFGMGRDELRNAYAIFISFGQCAIDQLAVT
jgi:hypothetical protein